MIVASVEHAKSIAGLREKFPATRLEPTVTGVGLTPWAVPIAATVIRDGAMSTAGAGIDMAAKYGGAAADNGQQDFDG